MNLELVPCMFKSRAGDGKESEVVGFVLRTPGSATGTIVPTTTSTATTIASKSNNSATKQPKIQPRRSDPIIAPKRIDSGPPKILPATSANATAAPILPAPLATSLSNGSIAVPSSVANKSLGIGSYIELPLTAFGATAPVTTVPTTTTTSKPPPKPRSKSTKATKSKAKTVEEIVTLPPPTILPAPPSLPSTSFELQSPPQLLPETNGTTLYSQTAVVSSSPPSYLPPISAIAPHGSGTSSSPLTNGYISNHQQQHLLSANGCTTDDLNAIEIAHSLSNEQKARNEYWNNSSHQQPPNSSHDQQQYYPYDSSSTYMYQQHPSTSSSHTGQQQPDGYHHNYPQPSSSEYSNNMSNNYGGYGNNNSHQHQQNGHHLNGHWIPQHQQQQQQPLPLPPRIQQQQQQYPGGANINNNNNQMTSSTPDSGIQSIDGSPPSTSAFTPPMVSPYPIQTNHFDPNAQTTMTVSAPQQQLQHTNNSTTQYSAGPMGSLRQSTRLSSEGPQSQSHIHLPPLNCMLPSTSTSMSQGISSTNMISDKSYLDQQQPSCSYHHNHQHHHHQQNHHNVESSLICQTNELDDIRIDAVQSISPPGLEDEKQSSSKEYDSDCDYSDMPILIRGDAATSKDLIEKESEPAARTSSRISLKSPSEKQEEEKSSKAVSDVPTPVPSNAIAINPNMDANEIAKMLMSSLPSEKVQELLRSFHPAIEKESNVQQPQPSKSKVIPPNDEKLPEKEEKEEKTIIPTKKVVAAPTAPKSRRGRKPSSTATIPSSESHQVNGNGNERPSTRSSTRNSSLPRPTTPPPIITTATKNVGKKSIKSRGSGRQQPTQQQPTPPPPANSNNQNNNNKVPSKTKNAAPKQSSKAVAPVSRKKASPSKTSKSKIANHKAVSPKKSNKKEKTVITILKTHPFLRNHRPTLPKPKPRKYKLVEAVPPSRTRPKSSMSTLSSSTNALTFYGFGSSRLNRPIPKALSHFLKMPSTLTTSRYEKCSEKLAEIFEKTHLAIPKVEMVKWEPSGAWKSPFVGDSRKRKTVKSSAVEPPKKIAKVDKKVVKKNDKFGPLKITIRRDSDASDFGAAAKKKKSSMITPITKDIDYVKIRSNILVESPPKLSTASKPCDCEDSDPCTSTSGCLSRAAHIECTHYSCQLFESCQNRRLESNLSVHQLQIFKHPTLNHAVRSLTDISKDQLVCEFVGEVMRKSTYLKKLEAGQSYPHYGVELIPGSYVIDASKKGNLSRFMNHSCEPNCSMQRWVVRGEQRIGIFALKDIESGVELTYDYSMHVYLKDQKLKCHCDSPNCQGIIPSMPPPMKAPSKPEKLAKSELQLVKKNKIFLQRNIRKYNLERQIAIPSTISSMPEISKSLSGIFASFIHSCNDKLPRRWLQHFSLTTKKVFSTSSNSANVVEFVESFDANMKCCLSLISKSLERKQADSLQQQYLHSKRQSNISELLKDCHPNTLLSFLAERPRNRKNDHSPRILSATTDLSYMNSEYPVGSYDPDKESLLFSQKCSPDGDSIRCVCGIMDEGGEMYQCDQCHFWLHRDCLGLSKEPDEYVCPFCEKNLKSTPLLDILLTPQPEYRIDSCIYYKTLVNCRGIQIRVNECVYVEKIINDEYKRRLKKFHEECVDGKTKSKKRKVSIAKLPPNVEEPSESIFKPEAAKIFDRKDLRTFRIERLFKVPTGERFAFGCYYARPHETFVDPGRMFYKNELFWTPLFDTLPLDVIVGRCLCLEPQEYAAGRPKGPKYHEDDLFVCEYSIDKTQKVFEKITLKNRYHINTAEYLFDRFEKPLTMKRNFTPFLIKTDNKKTNEKTSKNKLSSVAKQTGTIRLHQCMDKLLTLKP